jgi:hypothetical protein
VQIVEFASTLAELCGGYFEGRLTAAEYRMQRRVLLDELELMLNGGKTESAVAEPGSGAVPPPEAVGEESPGEVVDEPGKIGEDFGE